MLSPLRKALEDSIALHAKATGVREALEAEVCALFERVISAEGSGNVNVEEVAAAAMVAVESAVKDEVEAAAVVAATAAALDATVSKLQALSGGASVSTSSMDGEAGPAAAAAAAAAAGATPAASAAATLDAALAGAAQPELLESLTLSTAPAPVAAQAPAAVPAAAPAAAAAADAAAVGAGVALASLDGGGSRASGPIDPRALKQQQQEAAKRARRLLTLGLVAAAAAAGYAFLQTAAGQSVAGALSGAASSLAERFGPIHIGEAEAGLLQTIWLLLFSCICVPLVVKLLPGGNPVLGYLMAGAIVGPYALNLIPDVHQVGHLAEMGVVFLLFNIGLELSLDRLQSMAKYVFGMGAAQVVLTLLAIAAFAVTFAGLPGPSAIILGGALAMSTTAVAIQVLEDRGEMGSRHGRAAFSVLLFQDLAVVVLLMLIPLLAPDASGASRGGLSQIAGALGIAAVKAVICIAGITAGGRLFIRPLYKKISGLANAEIFAATTLLVVLGTSLMTQLAGLSLALGAFLAGLLLAETEYVLQVESDIAPYKGLLLGLFFMTVGMQISVALFIAKWKVIVSAIVILLAGKLAIMVAAGELFGLPRIAALRAGLLLASGGEFAFVAFGEAVAKGVLPAALTSELYLVVALSMAATPYLAALGGKLSGMLERSDITALQPQESETNELRNHVIICGYGRVGQIIAQMMSEQLIPFVALDVDANRIQAGKALDLPVYFGDAGSPSVLHLVGAERAACAVIVLDTPGANYRSVWAMKKHYPHIKTYVRAHDINHGINLEKAGATAVVPETLEPSLQLAAAVLQQLKLPYEEVASAVETFRRKHLSELQALAADMGMSMGYVAPKKPEREAEVQETDGSGSEAAVVLAPQPA